MNDISNTALLNELALRLANNTLSHDQLARVQSDFYETLTGEPDGITREPGKNVEGNDYQLNESSWLTVGGDDGVSIFLNPQDDHLVVKAFNKGFEAGSPTDTLIVAYPTTSETPSM